MASKSKKKSSATKKAAQKTQKQAARAAGKKAAKKAKKAVAKKATGKRAKGKSIDPVASAEAVLALDDLTEIDGLVADPKKVDAKTQAKVTKTSTPQTPSVPRSVKPPPKHANLEMSAEILQFVDAIDTYRQENSRPFPTWTEVFHILKQLGYTKSR